MKLPQKLETKTHSMTKKMLRLIANKTMQIKNQVNQKQRKMQPMQPSALQEMLKMLLTRRRIMLKN